MSLNYDLSRIPDSDIVCWETYTGTPEEMASMVARCTFMGPDWSWTDEYTKASVTRMSATTHTLVLLSMQVGLGSITDKNWREFYTRLAVIEKVLGPMRATTAELVYFTPDEVKAHIGLKTNVGDETKAKFNAKMARILREHASKALRS